MVHPDINLLVKPRSARILRAMRTAGFESVADLCRATGTSNPRPIHDLLNMKTPPINRKGEWREIALRIAACLKVRAEDLWPEHMRTLTVRKTRAEMEVSLDDAVAIASAEPSAQLLLEQKDVAEELLGCLTQRERAAISLRMNGATLAEAGRALGRLGIGAVTQERFRQIEQKAYRKMRDRAAAKFRAKEYDELFSDG